MPGLHRLAIECERLVLLDIGLADDERAADLGIVAVDAGRELGGHHVAALELLAARRRHAAHLRPADADDLEIVVDTLGAEEGLRLRDQLVVGATRTRRVTEHRVAFVRDLAGAADGVDLGGELAHQQAVEERRAVAQVEVLGARRELARDQPCRRGADAAVAQPVERLVDFVQQIGGVHDLDAVAFQRGTVGLDGTVDIECDAILAHDRERLAFEDAEVGGVAQIVVLPGVAVEQQDVEPLAHHLLQQPRPAIGENGHVRLRHSFQREKRASTMRTSSLSTIARSASVRTSAISAAGLKVSE